MIKTVLKLRHTSWSLGMQVLDLDTLNAIAQLLLGAAALVAALRSSKPPKE